MDDFESEHDDEASIDSRVKRNMDKPCRLITIEPDSAEGQPRKELMLEPVHSSSDQMKSNRRYSNCDEQILNLSPD